MWAQQLVKPGVFETVDVQAPIATDLREGDVLVRTLAGGICGSDVPKLWGHRGASRGPRGGFEPAPPGFPMHEVVGEVLATRDARVPVGSRVVGWARASDAIAERVITDGEQVSAYDPQRHPMAAVLGQSVACVLHALDRVEVQGKRVAVIGLGPIGVIFAKVAATRGATSVVGVDPVDRSSVASMFGLTETVVGVSRAWACHVGVPERPDVTIEAVGHQVSTLDDAITATATGGTIVYFGIPDHPVYPLDMESLMRKNLTLIGGVTRQRRRALRAADQYLRQHPSLYDALVTHEFDRSSIQQAYDTATRPAADRLKVLVSLG